VMGQEVLDRKCVLFPRRTFVRTSVDVYAGFCHHTVSTSFKYFELWIRYLHRHSGRAFQISYRNFLVTAVEVGRWKRRAVEGWDWDRRETENLIPT
jgi:hypothetical protein